MFAPVIAFAIFALILLGVLLRRPRRTMTVRIVPVSWDCVLGRLDVVEILYEDHREVSREGRTFYRCLATHFWTEDGRYLYTKEKIDALNSAVTTLESRGGF